MSSYEINIRGLEELSKGLKGASARAKDLRPILEQAYREAFVPHMQGVFVDQGPGWKPLNSEYLGWKVASGYPAAIGQLTGAMKRALATISRTQGTIKQIGKQRAIYGTSLDYASYFDSERDLLTSAVRTVEDYLDREIVAYILKPLQY